jgi:hypothetical protein
MDDGGSGVRRSGGEDVVEGGGEGYGILLRGTSNFLIAEDFEIVLN